MEDRIVHFCRAPSGLWIGWIVKDNAHYWGSGRTMDLMATHVKNTLYAAKKCSTAGYNIASKPCDYDGVPLDLMDKKFKTRAWYGGKGKEYSLPPIAESKPKTTKVVKVAEPEHYDYYETAMEGHDLVVFGVIKKQVARYNTLPTGIVTVTKTTTVEPAPLLEPDHVKPQTVTIHGIGADPVIVGALDE